MSNSVRDFKTWTSLSNNVTLVNDSPDKTSRKSFSNFFYIKKQCAVVSPLTNVIVDSWIILLFVLLHLNFKSIFIIYYFNNTQ